MFSRPYRYRITAQLFDADGAPLDIDFQVSEPVPGAIQGVGGLAAGGDRFLVIWGQRDQPGFPASPSHIFGRLYQAGPYPCPGDCGDARPLLRTGPPQKSADIIVYRTENLGVVEPPVGTGPEFGRFIVRTLVNGWFVHHILHQNRQKFNFYYIPLPVSPAEARGLSTKGRPPFDVDVRAQNTSGAGFAQGPHTEFAAGDHPSIFAHEVGHALFGLADERGCGPGDNIRIEPPRHPNIFATAMRCGQLSERGDQCFEIPDSRAANGCTRDPENDGWWKSDPFPDDVMVNAGAGRTFGPDCRKNITLFFMGLQ